METMIILKGISFALLGIGFFLLITYVVMRLWNWLVPSLFNGPKLRFVQALGLFFLVRLLVGFGGHGSFGHGGRFGQYNHWKHNGAEHGWYRDRSDRDEHRLKPVTPAPTPNQ